MKDKILLPIPFPDFIESTESFDDETLVQTALEALKMLNTLHGVDALNSMLIPVVDKHFDRSDYAVKIDTSGWQNHIGSLMDYFGVMVSTLSYRSRFRELPLVTHQRVQELIALHIAHIRLAGAAAFDASLPSWWGDVDVHNAHKGELFREKPLQFSQWKAYKNSFLPSDERKTA